MKLLITGADGFIGRNLRVVAQERGHEVAAFSRATPRGDLARMVATADAVAHLAGANRPPSQEGFERDNSALAEELAAALRAAGGARRAVAFASSTQAAEANPYGRSKAAAENALLDVADIADVAIFRLPNVFGKWSRPYYNSVVATFCHQAARGQPLSVKDPAAPLKLVYIDDVVSGLLDTLECPPKEAARLEVVPVYRSTVGEIAAIISEIAVGRTQLRVPNAGDGLERSLYATFLSFLPNDAFSYQLPQYGDARGRFVEAVKTRAAGQVSFFTQSPGQQRGGHYHHSKSEKFLVVKGRARFRFRHLLTGERVDTDADAEAPCIVDTVPGWTHDVVNLGNGELVVLVWANEVFDRARPDTVAAKVAP